MSESKSMVVVSTEADEEGRSSKVLGYFIGTSEQAITHCVKSGVKPYYKYRVQKTQLIDVSDVDASGVDVQIDDLGYVKVQESTSKLAANLVADIRKVVRTNPGDHIMGILENCMKSATSNRASYDDLKTIQKVVSYLLESRAQKEH